MIKKLVLTFIIASILGYFTAEYFFKAQVKRQVYFDAEQTAIILENVQDRFKLFLDTPLSIGMIGADYFSRGNMLKIDYHPFAKNLLEAHPEILGLNIVNTNGKIIRIYPEDKNSPALEKITQHFHKLKASMSRNEEFWISPPFNLYQGQQGFGFYIPIKRNSKLLGWFVPVVTTQRFFEKFNLSGYLKSYDLIIKDAETGLQYFSTALEPAPQIKKFESSTNFFTRNLIFQSWSKENSLSYKVPHSWSFAIGTFIGILACVLLWFYEQQKKNHMQLENISAILRLTAKDALSNLVDLNSEFKDKSGSQKRSMDYTINLIEQIDLLQTMAHAKENPAFENQPFLPLLNTQIENLEEVIHKKHLTFEFNQKSFEDVSIFMNTWLFENCVLFNLLSHIILSSQEGATILIENRLTMKEQTITFSVPTDNALDEQNLALVRRLEVVGKVLQIYDGDLIFRNGMEHHLIIKLILPHRS